MLLLCTVILQYEHIGSRRVRFECGERHDGKPGSELYLDATDYPERAMHQSTIVTEVIDGRETLVDLKSDSVI